MTHLHSVPPQRQPGAPLRAGIYGRASVDVHRRGRSVRDQFVVCRQECEERGWTVVDYYEDIDRSASSRATKTREDYERMVRDVEAGKLDILVWAEKSRAHRTLDAYVELRALCTKNRVLWSYDGRVFDLTKAADRRETARDAADSESEADSIADRNLRTSRLNAAAGGIYSKTPFGFMRRYDPKTGELIDQVAHPELSLVVIALFDGVDQGKSLNSLLPLIRPHRPKINTSGLRAILKNAAYIGIRMHRGVPYDAVWDGFVNEAVFNRVQLILNQPERRTQRGTGLVHELTGIPQCTVCRSEGVFKGLLPKGRFRLYRCPPQHVGIKEDLLDAYVEEAVLTWLGSGAAQRVFRWDGYEDALAAEQLKLKNIEDQLRDARASASQFDPSTGAPVLTVASLAAIESQLVPLEAAATARIRELMSYGDPLLDKLLSATADELDLLWSAELDINQRREIIRRVVRIEVGRAVRSGPIQDASERVGLLFAGEPGFAEWPSKVVAMPLPQRSAPAGV